MELIQKSNELILPTSGLEIAQKLEIKGDEGVQVALFPEVVEEIRLTDEWEPWKDTKAYGIICNWMSQTRLLDIMAPEDVRWWKVKNFAQKYGLDLVPIRWSGPIEEIPANYFNPGTILGLRFYKFGPWFWPLEKPILKEEPSEETKVIEEIVSI